MAMHVGGISGRGPRRRGRDGERANGGPRSSRRCWRRSTTTYGNDGGPQQAFGVDLAQDQRQDLRDAREGPAGGQAGPAAGRRAGRRRARRAVRPGPRPARRRSGCPSTPRRRRGLAAAARPSRRHSSRSAVRCPDSSVRYRAFGRNLAVAEFQGRAHRLGCPVGRVRDDAAHVGVEVGRVRFVAGSEVEDAAAAALVAAAAAEDFAALEPADEDEAVGGWDVERLAVHLLLLDHERLAEAFGDRVRPDRRPRAARARRPRAT